MMKFIHLLAKLFSEDEVISTNTKTTRRARMSEKGSSPFHSSSKIEIVEEEVETSEPSYLLKALVGKINKEKRK